MALTPLKAIRAKCIDCCCGSRFEVKMCSCADCPLYPYRLGHRPKGVQIDEEDAPVDETAGFPNDSEQDEDESEGNAE